MSLPPLLLCALGLTLPLAAQDAALPVTGLPAEDPVTSAILDSSELQVMEHLTELVEGIGPRLTSSDNLTEACEWAASRFEEWGLENVRLEEWGTIPVGFNRRVMKGRMTHPRKMPLTFTTNSWTAGTDGAQEGPVMLAPSNEEELAAAKGTMSGAWVLVSNTAPRFDSDEDGFADQLGRFLDEEGILGILRASRSDRVRTGGRWPRNPDDLPHRVSIQLVRDHWQELFRRVEADETTRVEFDLEHEFVPGPVPVYNVIGEIAGESDELVIVGGHIDSWDGARGAQDNGTGTSTTMEAARLLAASGVKPKRTIRFMLWSGEEQGLLGSRAYIEQHPEEMDRISCVLVHDGGTNACRGLYATPAMMPMFEEVLAPLLARYADHEDEHLRFRIRPLDNLPRGIGSDHDAYLAGNNPAPGFFWDQSGETSYGFIHHTQNDLLQYVRADYQEYTSKVVATAAWRFANAQQMVPRDGMLPPPPRRLGVMLSEDGVTIASLSEGGAAEKGGLKAGDKLLSLGETAIEDQGSLRRAIRMSDPQATLVVEREGEQLKFDVDWEERSISSSE